MNKKFKRCIRKIIAAAMVLTLVGGFVPFQPIADMAAASTVTANAVEYNGARQALKYNYDEATRTMTIKAGTYNNPSFPDMYQYEAMFDKIVAEPGVVLKGNCNGLFLAGAHYGYPSTYFWGAFGTKEIDLSGVDTSSVTDMSSMFSGCDALTTLKIDSFDTSNVTDMSNMFSDCSSLSSIDLSHFNTSEVTNMSYMFYGCQQASDIDVSSFDTSKVTNMNYMFNDCKVVTELDLRKFDMQSQSKSPTVYNMFANCNMLNKISMSDKTDITSDCRLTNIVSGDTGSKGWYNENDPERNIVSGSGQYAVLSGEGTYLLLPQNESLKYSFSNGVLSFKAGTYSGDMLKEIVYKISKNSITSITAESGTAFSGDISEAFSYCENLTEADLSAVDMSAVTSAKYMFSGCSNLNKVDLTGVDLSSAGDLSYMFSSCSKLETIKLDNITFGGGINISGMFNSCKKLEELDLTSFGTGTFSGFSQALYYCNALVKLTIPDGLHITTDWGLNNNSESSMGYKGWADINDPENVVSGTDSNADISGAGTYIHVKNNPDVSYTIDTASRTLTLSSGGYNSSGMRQILQEYSKEISSYGNNFPSKIIVEDGVRFYGDCSKMFYISYDNYSSGIELEIGNVDTSGMTSMQYMFRNITGTLDLSSFDTSNITNMGYAFYQCKADSIDLSSFDMRNIDSENGMYYMFKECTSDVTLGDNCYIPKISRLSYMFEYFDGKVNAGKLIRSNITDISQMFQNTGENLQVDFTGADASSVTTIDSMFSSSKIKSLDLSPLVCPNVTDADNLLSNCSMLENLVMPDLTSGALTDARAFFSGCSALKSVDLSKINFKNVINFEYLFSGCSSLTSVDVSMIKPKIPVNTGYMFKNCSSLKSIDISSLDMSNVTYISSMFEGCSALTELNLGEFDTPALKNMYALFSGCSSLTSVDLGKINTSKVSQFDNMFKDCSSMETIDVSKLDTSSASSVTGMFQGCTSLKSVDISGFDLKNITSLSSFFEGCSSLESAAVNPKNTSKISSLKNLFKDCTSLKTVDLSGMDVSNISSTEGMFSGCTMLENAPLSIFKNSEKISSVTDMFNGCTSIKNVDLSELYSRRITNFTRMFSGCTALENVDFDGLDFTNPDGVTYTVSRYMNEMFSGCTSLKSFTVSDSSTFKTAKITNISGMFKGCTALENFSFNNWNTAEVSDMSSMFSGCTSLKSVDLTALKTDKVTTMASMFKDCSSLTEIIYPAEIKTISQSLNDISEMYSGCSSVTYLKPFPTSSSTSYPTISRQFTGCSSLKTLDLTALKNFGRSNSWYFDNADSVETIILPASLAITGTDHLVNATPYYSGWYKADDETKEIISGSAAYAVIAAQTEETTIKRERYEVNNVKIAGCSLSLDGTIGLNYYLRLPEDLVNDKDAYVEYEINGNKTVSKFADLKNSYNFETTDGYRIRCDLAAKELHDDVTIRFYNGSGEALDIYNSLDENKGTEYKYSAMTYIDTVKNSSDSDELLVKLVKALETYGCYAQKYFQYNADSIDFSKLNNVSSVKAEDLSTYTLEGVDGLPDDIEYVGCSLILESETTIRLYFKADNMENYCFGGSSSSSWISPGPLTDKSGDMYYFDFSGINASELSESVYMSIYDATTEGRPYLCDIDLYPLHYARLALEKYGTNPAKSDLCNTMRALKLYNDAAVEYFSQK